MKKFIGDQIKRFFETGKWAMKLIFLVVLVELGLVVGVVATMGNELTVRTELVGGTGKYGRLLGWLYINEDTVSLNEQMITEGYAHAYDGGTKDMNLEKLREIRRSFGTLTE